MTRQRICGIVYVGCRSEETAVAVIGESLAKVTRGSALTRAPILAVVVEPRSRVAGIDERRHGRRRHHVTVNLECRIALCTSIDVFLVNACVSGPMRLITGVLRL